jgi:hypothetical protein
MEWYRYRLRFRSWNWISARAKIFEMLSSTALRYFIVVALLTWGLHRVSEQVAIGHAFLIHTIVTVLFVSFLLLFFSLKILQSFGKHLRPQDLAWVERILVRVQPLGVACSILAFSLALDAAASRRFAAADMRELRLHREYCTTRRKHVTVDNEEYKGQYCFKSQSGDFSDQVLRIQKDKISPLPEISAPARAVAEYRSSYLFGKNTYVFVVNAAGE